ncbi:MAG: hypothetical protein ACJ8EB_05490 [Allosphingosinicella sp.]
MPEWRFLELKDGEVEQEPTQRDQFNNDDVGLAAALVRESIQNSTDAPSGAGAVKVRFDILQLSGAEAAEFRTVFETLKPHLDACGISCDALGEDLAQVLIIEDFNTRGLTGATDQLDEDNFRNFWRRHGKSGKSGSAGGRWGLGKLVYSSASRLNCFFGLTLRRGDQNPLLLGQAVLGTHEFAATRRPPHGFWFESATERGLQLPVTEVSTVRSFSELVGLKRTDETGLSLVIPYPRSSITKQSIISGVVSNYYFPILAGRLEVEVGDTSINRQTFIDVAAGVTGATIPLEFVSAVSERLGATPDAEGALPVNLHEVSAAQFPQQLPELRDKLAAGGLVHVRFAVEVTPRRGESANQKVASTFEVFLQTPLASADPFALFVRGSLTVPGEKRSFAGAAAWGAMVASAGPIADFLGDAENPAHTLWNATAEKLLANWVNPGTILRNIRYAPRQLQQLLGEQVEQQDPNALIDFFSLLEQSSTGEARKRRRSRRKPLVITPREKSLQVQPRSGGFAVVAGPGAKKWAYPTMLRIRVAYDIIGADPFKRWSPFDFTVEDSSIELSLTAAKVVSTKGNIVRVIVECPDFRVEARGFDLNRDIIVEARSV